MKNMFGRAAGHARPTAVAQPSAPTAPAPRAASFLPEPGSRGQYDMTRALLTSGMVSAGQSNNPLMAFMAPLASTMIGMNAEDKFKSGERARNATQVAAMTELLGGNKKAEQLLTMMSNEDTPDYMQSIAGSMLDDIIKPPKGRAKSRTRQKDRNGVLRYVDTGEAVFPSVTGSGAMTDGRARQMNQAVELITDAVDTAYNDGLNGLSLEEAKDAVRSDPLYARQFEMLEGADISEAIETPQTEELTSNEAPPPPPGTVAF